VTILSIPVLRQLTKQAKILCYRLRDHKYAAITFITGMEDCQYFC